MVSGGLSDDRMKERHFSLPSSTYLQVSYKTAWFLCHRVRAAMREVSADLLKGIVEIDETYIGGKFHGRGSGYKGNKAVTVGAVEREGEIRLSVIKSPNKYWLHKFIHETTDPKCEAIYTDEAKAYEGIEDADTRHETVKHLEEQWVKGDLHTNNVESVWSLLKRSVVGTYHKFSIKHLDAYLDELEYRLNNRKNKFLFWDTFRNWLRRRSCHTRDSRERHDSERTV